MKSSLFGVVPFFLIHTFVFEAAEIQGADWPTWMGPDLTGISLESGWSAKWPEAGLPTVWTQNIGIGFSSVSIVDGRLYTMGHDRGKESVWCLNSQTGEVLWSHSYPAPLHDNLYEGGPGATPVVHADCVYTLSIDGRLLCLDRITGTVIWEKLLQQDLGVGFPDWGFDSTPFILNDQLILQAGRLVSYDLKTGRKNWQTSRHTAGYGAVRAFQQDDKTLLASLDNDGLRICQATDGTQVAFAKWDSPFKTNSTTPIIHDGLIYISTGYNIGCGLFRLQNGRLEQIYANREMRNHFNNSILYNGHVYGVDGNSNLGRVVTITCMDFETGKLNWKQRGLGCGSLTIADGKLLILSEDGTLVLADATPEEFREVARSPFLTGRCWTVPVLLNGKIYGRNAAGTLKCVQLPPDKR
ncbi:MAG: PQQ-binding-like beta-propeller repeat protein [Planctomycetaceae bacterium]